jgi:hypothetical protein
MHILCVVRVVSAHILCCESGACTYFVSGTSTRGKWEFEKHCLRTRGHPDHLHRKIPYKLQAFSLERGFMENGTLKK